MYPYPEWGAVHATQAIGILKVIKNAKHSHMLDHICIVYCRHLPSMSGQADHAEAEISVIQVPSAIQHICYMHTFNKKNMPAAIGRYGIIWPDYVVQKYQCHSKWLKIASRGSL